MISRLQSYGEKRMEVLAYKLKSKSVISVKYVGLDNYGCVCSLKSKFVKGGK